MCFYPCREQMDIAAKLHYNALSLHKEEGVKLKTLYQMALDDTDKEDARAKYKAWAEKPPPQMKDYIDKVTQQRRATA